MKHIHHKKLTALNARGISHYLLPLLIVVIVSVLGTYKLVASHADAYIYVPIGSNCPAGSSLWDEPYNYNGKSVVRCKQSAAPAQSASSGVTSSAPSSTDICANHPTAACALQEQRRQQKKNANTNAARNTDAAENVANAPQATDTTADPQPVAASISTYTSKPAAPTVKPEGNLVVLSCLHKDCNPKHIANRIGGVGITISRAGGNEKCDNHTRLSLLTNKTTIVHGKVAKGSAHFLGCTAGSYTITTTGRSGYTVVSAKSKQVSLAQDQIVYVKFYLVKK